MHPRYSKYSLRYSFRLHRSMPILSVIICAHCQNLDACGVGHFGTAFLVAALKSKNTTEYPPITIARNFLRYFGNVQKLPPPPHSIEDVLSRRVIRVQKLSIFKNPTKATACPLSFLVLLRIDAKTSTQKLHVIYRTIGSRELMEPLRHLRRGSNALGR